MLTVTRSAEASLVEMLAEIRDQAGSWTAVAFHFDRLLDQYRSDYQLKIAVNLVNDLLQHHEGVVYTFADGVIVVLGNHMTVALINKLIFQLRYLCMDDPLAYTEDGNENPGFCMVYRLGSEWQPCINFATQRMTRTLRNVQAAAPQTEKPSFSAARLALIERELAQVDLSPAIRCQPVCAVMSNGSIRTVFDELYIQMQHLRQLLKSEVDFLSNPWLFRYLTQLLDERVVKLVSAEPAKYLARPVSLNLNVEALLSDWFAAFDAALPPAQKVGLVFEVPIVDVFADMAAFAYARDRVQKLGYRVCIDGVTVHSLLHVDRSRLHADLLKLQWNAGLSTDKKTAEHAALAKAVDACGANRVILCRCDSKAAVEYGQTFGLSLFQGRYLDGLLHPQAKVSN